LGNGQLDVLAGGVHAGFNAFTFEVGTTNGDGDVIGVADVVGGISGYQFYEIGINRANSTGNASGSLSVHDGPVDGSRMRVGVSEGAGVADGRVSLERTLVSLDDTLFLGSGSTLDFHLSGLLRGIEYAGIDTPTASLDGTANIFFDFTPTPGSHVFDLIVTEALNGLSGNFDVGAFNIFGLDPTFTATHGIVVDNVLGNDVEIYRLEISSAVNSIPEPHTVVLIGFGLFGLLVYTNRRRNSERAC
jgi:hypothetical protein